MSGGIARAIGGRVDRAGQRAAEAVFTRAALRHAGGEAGRQLFILGLPRSGTTLVYQYIVHRKHVAYFTNGVGRHSHAPCLTSFLQKRRHPPYQSDFASEYGRSAGPMAPREAGAFWPRFFDIDAYQTLDDVRPADVERLRRTIRCMQVLFDDAPFVNKNVKHLLRIEALAAIFPRSHFLVVTRDLGEVALSVLRGRVRHSGGVEAWFSAKPRNIDALLSLPPVEQVAGQIEALQRSIADDLSPLDASRVHRVVYEEFCARPETVFESLGEAFAGLPDKNEPAAGFEVRRSTPENEDETRLLERVGRGAGGLS
jgi:hypothetical protein